VLETKSWPGAEDMSTKSASFVIIAGARTLIGLTKVAH
jgi:hypothetical protein